MTKKKQDINTLVKDLSSKDGMTRNKARIALVEIGEPSVEPLIKVLTDKSQTVRWASAKALSQIMDPRSIDALVNALQDRLFDVRWLAAEGLIAIGSKSVKPLLQAIMDNPDSEYIREGAHHIFHDLRGGKYGDILKPLINSMEDPTFTLDIPLVARKALQEIE